MHSDETYVGRAAPEIDIFEAQVSETYLAVSVRRLIGDLFVTQITGTPLSAQVSQSAQWAVSKPTSAHD
jgi:hypothetical protein